MNTKTIDLANIGLMLVSCVLAFVIPFELFIFSYAVLGPLHYLTEISWLKKRDYFTNGKKDYIYLVIPCIIVTFISLVATYNYKPGVHEMAVYFYSVFGNGFYNFSYIMIFVAFLSALAFVIFKDWLYKFIFVSIVLFAGILMQHSPSFLIVFAILLPTVIHIFVFTGLFMLNGALKTRSATGIAAMVVFALCAVSFFVWRPVFDFYNITDYARKAVVMDGKGFINLNTALINFFQMGKVSMETVFHSPIGLSIGRFIAFGYTYHYLNWFSKTEVIKWHKVPTQWLVLVISLWVFSILLYMQNYKTGLMALYFLSMLHVFLEFPLNYRSVIGIGEELAGIAGLSKPVVVKNKIAGTKSRKK